MPNYEPGEKFLRVIQLLQRLSDTEQGLTTAQLADELEVTTRSVQRYIATLRDSVGMDIEESEGRFRIGDRTKLPAMQLDHYQATSLLIALRLLFKMRSEQDPALVGALAQLARALRVPVVNRYLEATVAAAEQRPMNPGRWQVERTGVDGFVRRQAVEIRYRDAQGSETKRVLHPYFLEPRPEGRAIYVVGLDELSAEVRTLKLERIVDARLIGSSFEVPADFDIDATTSGSWGIWLGIDGAPDDVELIFDADVVRRLKETRWHPGAVLTDLPDGRVSMTVRVASEVEMRPWVLGWGGAVRVEKPESLRHYVVDSLRRGLAQYD